MRQARRLAGRLRPVHLAALLAVVIAGVGLAGVRAATAPGQPSPAVGERLEILVVAPVEPEIRPGPVMEVGDLVDVLDRLPAPISGAVSAMDVPVEDARPRYRPSPPVRVGEAIRPGPAPSEPPGRDGLDGRVSRWFGFDAPGRDYRAERTARREAREAQDREERAVRRYRSGGDPEVDGRDDVGYGRDEGAPSGRAT